MTFSIKSFCRLPCMLLVVIHLISVVNAGDEHLIDHPVPVGFDPTSNMESFGWWYLPEMARGGQTSRNIPVPLRDDSSDNFSGLQKSYSLDVNKTEVSLKHEDSPIKNANHQEREHDDNNLSTRNRETDSHKPKKGILEYADRSIQDNSFDHGREERRKHRPQTNTEDEIHDGEKSQQIDRKESNINDRKNLRQQQKEKAKKTLLTSESDATKSSKSQHYLPRTTTGSHGAYRSSPPSRSIYLAVTGGSIPELPPEVYYRFTVRSLGRRGGAAHSVSIHKANVIRDRNSWRADITSPLSGTVEVFSRFMLDSIPIYSQYNYQYRVSESLGKGVQFPPLAELPVDWPIFLFPGYEHNIPFEEMQTGESLEFTIQAPVPVEHAVILEQDKNTPEVLSYSEMSRSYLFYPEYDEQLAMAGGRASKRGLILAKMSGDGGWAIFSFAVRVSRWSNRSLGWGIITLASAGFIITLLIAIYRRRFAFNDIN